MHYELLHLSTMHGQLYNVAISTGLDSMINVPQPDNFRKYCIQTLLCPDKVAVQTIISQWRACTGLLVAMYSTLHGVVTTL